MGWRGMNGVLLWLTMAVLGATATLMTSFGLLPTVGLAFVVVRAPRRPIAAHP